LTKWGILFILKQSRKTEAGMCKLKTHSGTKKRFRMSSTGKILRAYAFKKHNLRKRSKDMKRASRGTVVMHASDAKIIRRAFIPYGLA
jgi:large subunit ribosomal protein L35